MPEWLNNQLIFWGSITLMSTVPVITYYWHKVRKIELETELKREMVQRGMSADEIVQVLRARPSQEPHEAGDRHV